MSILELEGEVARLREAAKAHAEGMLSRDDYRHYRAKVIENLSQAKEGAKGDTDDPPEEALLAGDSPLRLLSVVGLAALLVFTAFVTYLIYVG